MLVKNSGPQSNILNFKLSSRAIKLILAQVITIIFSVSILFAQSGSTDPQARDSDNKADQNLKSMARVNPSTLAMEMNVPLMAYPGRAGNSLPVAFSYSSKLWRMDVRNTWRMPPIGPSGYTPYMTNLGAIFSERSAAGWSSSLAAPVLEEKLETYEVSGKPFTNILTQLEADNIWRAFLASFGGSNPETMGACAVCVIWGANDVCLMTQHGGGYGNQLCQDPWNTPEPGGSGGGGGGTGGQTLQRQKYYVKRVHVRMPDGATHELRKSDAAYGYCDQDTPTNGPNCEGAGPNWLSSYLAVDGSGMRLDRTAQGSTLYLPNGGKFHFLATGENVSGKMKIYPATDFRDVNGNLTQYTEVTEQGIEHGRIIDTLSRPVDDPLPQNLWRQNQRIGTQEVALPGMGEGHQIYQLKWLPLKPVGCEIDTNASCGQGKGALEDLSQKLYYDTNMQCFGSQINMLSSSESLFTGHSTGLRSCASADVLQNSSGQPVLDSSGNAIPAANRFNAVVLSEIVLPNGKSYKFKYNQWGEITRIDYPGGSYERFSYDLVLPITGYGTPAYDQTNRGVKERWVYKSANDASTDFVQHWTYAAAMSESAYPYSLNATYDVTAISSKSDNASQQGAKTVRSLYRGFSEGKRFGFDDPRVGMVKEEKAYDEGGALRSRALTDWIVTGPVPTGEQNHPARSEAQRDPRVKRTVSVIIEGTQALATMSENVFQDPATDSGVPTDISYFATLNVKEKRSHHYRSIPAGTAENGDIAAIAVYFNDSSLASVSKTEYWYPESYWSRGISSLPIRTKMFDPANQTETGILAKSELIYDQLPAPNSGSTYPLISAGYSATWQDPNSDLRGNVTTSRTWVKETGTWLETHARYDNFGNLRFAWDASGDESKFVETVYEHDPGNDKPYYFAYPTKVIAPAPAVAGPAANHGTTETSSSETTYDPTTGLVLTVKDDFGQIIRNEYNDPLLRLKKTYGENFTAPITETFYDDNALTVTVRKQIDETNWDEATTFMDSLGRVRKSVAKDSQGDVTVETHYDLLGRVDRATSPYRAGDTVYWSKTRYDEAGRAVESYAPAAISDITNNTNLVSLGTTSFGISNVTNYVGTVVTSSDASGRKERSITNALGQLLRVDEPTAVGGTTADDDLGAIGSPTQPTYYKYDLYGNMVQVTQGAQNRYFKYDSLGRLIRVRQPEQEINPSLQTSGNPDNNDWTAGFTYDVLGNLVTSTDAKGTIITNYYDRAGRVILRDYSDSTPDVTFAYDGKGLVSEQTPINYAKGKLTLVDSSVSQTSYKLFDNFGRLKEMEQRTPINDTQQPWQADARVSKYTYNFSGALIEEEYPSGRKVKNEFEPGGDLKRVYGTATSTATEHTYANSFSYTASGGISQMRLGNGRWETAQFNSRLQITQLGLGNSATDTSLWKVNYQYGELNIDGSVNTNKNTGNIAKQTLTIPGTSFSQYYKYDPLYRLTEAKEFTGTNTTNPNWTQAFGYDLYGNRTSFSQNIGGVQTNTTPAVNANTNRFTSTNFTYDKNGNIVGDIDPVTSSARQFVFNGDNKQVEVNRGSINVGKYYYDGEGKRVKKVTATETTIFVYLGSKLVAEYSTQISATPTISYMTGDHLGSPRIITDKFGNVKSRRDFMPFGEDVFAGIGGRTGDTGQKYSSNADDIRQKFTGYQKDSETTLDFAEARMYENRYGRFTAIDPLIASGKSSDPQTFNRYAYTSNNPVVRVDINGEDWYYYRDLEVTRSGRSFYHTKIYWRDEIGGGRHLYRGPGIIFETIGKNINKYTALDPFEGRSESFDTREEAVQQYQSYLRDGKINATRGISDAIASLAMGDPLTHLLYEWGADAVIGKPDPESNVYTVTNKTTNAMIIVGTAVGVPGLAATRGPGLASEANAVIATGERHHLLTNKIMRALNKSETLKGVFNRENARFIYNAADEIAHKGYQKWHREYDRIVTKWIKDNGGATADQFIKFLDDLHQQPWLKERIPNVKL